MENTRITCLKQVIFLVILLCVLAHGPTPAHADSEGTGSISVVPGNGAAQGIRLRTQTVDLVIKEDASAAWAETNLRVQLYNRGAAPVSIPIAIPGPQVGTTALPEITEVTLGGYPLALTRIPNPDKPEIQATATITVPVQGNADIRIRYRQALTTKDGLVSYAYPLIAGHVWAGAPEALRVTITFPQPLPAERIMHLAPAPRSSRPGTFTWEWGGAKAPSNVGLAFMSSEWWRELEAARTAAAAPGAELAEHVALGERYWHMATIAPPAFAPRASFYDRYSSLAIVEWRAGIAAAKADTDPVELATARERLSGLYLAEANRQGGAVGQAYLQLAVDELMKAVALNPGDIELRDSATALQGRLGKVAESRGDEMGSSAHVSILQELKASGAAPDADEGLLTEVVLLAQRAAAAGDYSGARRILADAFGADVLSLPDAGPPRISQALLNVNNVPGRRTIGLQLMDHDGGIAATEVVAEAVTALRGLSDVISSGTALTLTLDYSDPAALLSRQDQLSAALPDVSELALLSSALSTRHFVWPVQENLLTQTDGYQESADLSKSVIAWEAEAEKLEQAANEAESRGQPLDSLRAAIWRDDARAWRDLGVRSRAIYQTELQGSGTGPNWLLERVRRLYREDTLQRQWVVRAGEVRQLEASVLAWRYDRLALAGAAVLLLVGIGLLAVWAVLRTPREPNSAGATDASTP